MEDLEEKLPSCPRMEDLEAKHPSSSRMEDEDFEEKHKSSSRMEDEDFEEKHKSPRMEDEDEDEDEIIVYTRRDGSRKDELDQFGLLRPELENVQPGQARSIGAAASAMSDDPDKDIVHAGQGPVDHIGERFALSRGVMNPAGARSDRPLNPSEDFLQQERFEYESKQLLLHMLGKKPK